MSQAIVFDSAGTLLETTREVTEVATHKLLPSTIETTLLTSEDKDRLLILLNFSTNHLLQSEESKLLSSWIKQENISFGISFGRLDFTHDMVTELLRNDVTATVSDLQLAVKTCRDKVETEKYLFALNGGLIINSRQNTIEYCIASAGHPFSGVKELIFSLQQKGIAAFIASGDRTEKLELVADAIGIPRSHVLGVATPGMKASLVLDLKKEYDTVLMVGDGINDIEAMYAADISILTMQQNTNPPEILKNAADYIITDISTVLKYVEGA